jgi:hypothetical protein
MRAPFGITVLWIFVLTTLSQIVAMVQAERLRREDELARATSTSPRLRLREDEPTAQQPAAAAVAAEPAKDRNVLQRRGLGETLLGCGLCWCGRGGTGRGRAILQSSLG